MSGLQACSYSKSLIKKWIFVTFHGLLRIDKYLNSPAHSGKNTYKASFKFMWPCIMKRRVKRDKPTRTPHAVIHGLVLLMMGIMMPETCWDRSLIINIGLVASCWFISLHPTYKVLIGYFSTGFQNWNPSLRAATDCTYVRTHSHCDRLHEKPILILMHSNKGHWPATDCRSLSVTINADKDHRNTHINGR